MGFFDLFKKKKKRQQSEKSSGLVELADTSMISPNDKLLVVIEELTALQVNEASLVEITDKNIVAKIDELIPAVANTSASAINAVKDAANNSEPLYRVVLQNGGDLVNSKNMEGAKRAWAIVDGQRENANLVRVQPNGLDKAGDVASIGANVMSVASMIVGQYYMQQVDKRIAALQAGVSAIMDFLDIQYKSRVLALLESVYNITKFQMSNIENEELRNRELDNLQRLKLDCLELLNQSELHLQSLTAENCKDYSEYVNSTKAIEKWVKFQNVLLQLLNQISILDFALHIGIKVKEQCFDSLLIHMRKVEKTRKVLTTWHEKQCKELKIDLIDKRRKNTGFWAFLEKPISLINDKWNYRDIDEKTVALIQSQSSEKKAVDLFEGNLFDKNVNIIVIGNKKYFSPI